MRYTVITVRENLTIKTIPCEKWGREKNISNLGIGISVEQLVKNIYKFLSMIRGADDGICIVNDRYLEIDGETFQFIRKKFAEAWVVKVIK